MMSVVTVAVVMMMSVVTVTVVMVMSVVTVTVMMMMMSVVNVTVMMMMMMSVVTVTVKLIINSHSLHHSSSNSVGVINGTGRKAVEIVIQEMSVYPNESALKTDKFLVQYKVISEQPDNLSKYVRL